MSVLVELDKLADTAADFDLAYLITVGGDAGSGAHVLAITPEITGDGIVCGGLGRHSLGNATANANVTLVWAPAAATDYSLIVDGEAAVDGEQIVVTPRKAILHRPARDPSGARTGNDCQPV